MAQSAGGSSSSKKRASAPDLYRPISDIPVADLPNELQLLRTAYQQLLEKKKEGDRAYLQLLLDDRQKAAASRRWRVSGTLALVGIVLVLVSTPLTLVASMSSVFKGAFGYSLGALILGAAVALLAVMPADARTIRFLTGFYAECAFIFGSSYLFALVPLSWSGAHCVYGSEATCRSVGGGLFFCGLVLYWLVAALLWTLRQVPRADARASMSEALGEGERVPVRELWRWTRKRLGRWPAVAALAVTLVVPVWAIAQPQSSFVVSPRVALRRAWAFIRVACLCWGTSMAGILAIAYTHAEGKDEPVLPSLICVMTIFFLVGFGAWQSWEAGSSTSRHHWLLLAAPRSSAALGSPEATTSFGGTSGNRARVHEALGKLGTLDENNAAAVVAAVVGRTFVPKVAYEKAAACFFGIPFASLTRDDFRTSPIKDLADTSAPHAALKARTQAKKLGEVDVFLSHSWHDPVNQKWKALSTYATQFEARHRRTPVLWLDKACIDQINISESLPCLPIFLSGCKQLLVIAGPTYTQRLWCIMEIFTFMYMGGELGRIVLLPIVDKPAASVAPAGPAAAAPDGQQPAADSSCRSVLSEGSYLSPEMSQIRKAFASFDARDASCHIENDKQHLLGVIETGLGSVSAVRLEPLARRPRPSRRARPARAQLDAFNKKVRNIFAGEGAFDKDAARRSSPGRITIGLVGNKFPQQRSRSLRSMTSSSGMFRPFPKRRASEATVAAQSSSAAASRNGSTCSEPGSATTAGSTGGSEPQVTNDRSDSSDQSPVRDDGGTDAVSV